MHVGVVNSVCAARCRSSVLLKNMFVVVEACYCTQGFPTRWLSKHAKDCGFTDHYDSQMRTLILIVAFSLRMTVTLSRHSAGSSWRSV